MRWLVATFLVAVVGAIAPAAAVDRWQALKIPAVTLVDDTGSPRQLDALIADRPVILGFFFTACRKVCPLQTATMLSAHEDLRRRGVAPEPLLLSISVQPLSDTPDSITSYARKFGISLGDKEGWFMLTGRERDLARVWEAFGEDGGSPDEHTGQFWIKHPGHGWLRLAADSSPERIAQTAETGR